MGKFDLLEENKIFSNHQASFREIIKKWFNPFLTGIILLFFLFIYSGFIGSNCVFAMLGEYTTRTFDLKTLTFEEARFIAEQNCSPLGSVYIARNVNKLIVRDKLENIMKIERLVYLKQNGLGDSTQVMIMARLEDEQTKRVLATPSFSLLQGMSGKYEHYTDSGGKDSNGIVNMFKTGISVSIVPVKITGETIEIEVTALISEVTEKGLVEYEIKEKDQALVKKEGAIKLKNEKKGKKGYIFRYVLSII